MTHLPTARGLRTLVLAGLAAAPLWALAPRHAASTTTEVARVIVKYRADGALARETIAAAGGHRSAADRPQHAQRMAQRMGLALRDGHVVMPRVQVLHAQGLSSAALAARLAADPDVEYAEVDLRARIAAVPNDPIFTSGPPVASQSGGPVAGQWYLRAPNATTPAAINAQAAWDLSLGTGVVVAVLDTGVRLTHPDLAGKLLPGYDFVAADAGGAFDTAADGDGRDSDPTDPGDWVAAGQCSGQSATSSSWHGTQVAGLVAAAANNGLGIAGTGYNARVLPVRVLGKCGGYQSDIVAGMRWAAGLAVDGVPVNANPARVINLSLGSAPNYDIAPATGCSPTYAAAVQELVAAGVVVIAAAGNEIGAEVIQPARCAGAIAVAGIRHFGTKVGYSNIGLEAAIAAPAGNCINVRTGDACVYPLVTTTNLGAQSATTDSYSDSFDISVGTSFAGPLVAGTVALMVALDPTLSVARVRGVLQSTANSFVVTGADPGTPMCQPPRAGLDQDECYCTTTTCGAGMLSAAGAVALVAATAPPVAHIAESGLSPGAGGSVVLRGESSTVRTGSAIVYAWSIASGSALASISGPDNASAVTLALSSTGLVTVQLTVTDSTGATGTSSHSFLVAGPPTARVAISPSAPSVGVNVALDAANSTAQGNRSIASWRWVVSGGSAGAALVGGATGSTASVSVAAAGSFDVQLTVTDNAGASHTTNQSVSVGPALNTGGGGGALGWPWLVGLGLAVAALPGRRAAGRRRLR
jgi:serine protease